MAYVEPGRQRFDITLPDELAEAIKAQAKAQRLTFRRTIEDLLWAGLATTQAQRMEHQALPALRTVINDEQTQAMEALVSRLHDDMEAIVKRQGDRLATMMMRVILEAGIGWRLMFGMLQRLASQEPTEAATTVANRLLEEARDKSQRAMSRAMHEKSTL